MTEWLLVRHPKSGREKYVTARAAAVFARLKGWEIVDEETDESAAPAATDDLESMTYWELRALAKRRGIELDGLTRRDVLAALRGEYLRRDMRAED